MVSNKKQKTIIIGSVITALVVFIIIAIFASQQTILGTSWNKYGTIGFEAEARDNAILDTIVTQGGISGSSLQYDDEAGYTGVWYFIDDEPAKLINSACQDTRLGRDRCSIIENSNFVFQTNYQTLAKNIKTEIDISDLENGVHTLTFKTFLGNFREAKRSIPPNPHYSWNLAMQPAIDSTGTFTTINPLQLGTLNIPYAESYDLINEEAGKKIEKNILFIIDKEIICEEIFFTTSEAPEGCEYVLIKDENGCTTGRETVCVEPEEPDVVIEEPEEPDVVEPTEELNIFQRFWNWLIFWR